MASASLHPTRLVTDDPDAPYRDAPKVRGAYYSGFGELDHYTPPEVIAEVAAAFAGQRADYTQLVHAGAAHGYAIADRDVYDPAAAYRDWRAAFSPLLERHLADEEDVVIPLLLRDGVG